MKIRDNKRLITVMPDFGKVPPQAIDMEQAVLGLILIYPDVMNDVCALLEPDMFYKEAHQKIYQSCVTIFKKTNKADLLTVTEELRANNELDSVGGPLYITQLCERYMSINMVEDYALIVKQKYFQREMIRVSTELQSMAFDDTYDVSELFEYAETSLLQITGKVQKKDPLLLGSLVDKFINKIQRLINREISLIGIPSGFTQLDRITGGFKTQELIIVAGRPGMGKTAVALQIAKNTAELNNPIGFFSLEMSGESLAGRSISNVSGKTNVELLTGRCNIDDLISQTEQLMKLGIYIDDTSHISIIELRAKCRKLILQHGIKMIFVDYLQLMKGEGQNREQEVSSISRGLKSMAKDLDISVIALSQINRECESRSNKRPALSDLRESGAIEQDADMVILVYRPSYYKIDTITINSENRDSRGVVLLDIAKNRNGAIGEFMLMANESITELKEVNYEI